MKINNRPDKKVMKNMIYMLGILVALLILLSVFPKGLHFSASSGRTNHFGSKLRVIGKESQQVLMFNDNEIKNSCETNGRFSKKSGTDKLEDNKKKTGYLAIKSEVESREKPTPDYDIITE
ncbi:hypothetical protein QQ020_01470 [Fulvivirgaceae bacterium BMA12]|uniref:Uncharacterized protein n=1 Tax=Agaribacillus aureus TaxID=3051825 RepID=A0ABT8KYX9_9BACT|nr:hypothetical protein [Fulvivirgaceae bacterium BMA12]